MRNTRTDSGNYNRPAQIQAPAARVDDGQGGNAAAGNWITVRDPFIRLYSKAFGRGLSRLWHAMQLYPEATHWAECRYADDTQIDATMTLLADNRRYQVLGALDLELEHVTLLIALVEYQAKGSI